MSIKLASDLSLPLNAVTQTFGFIGRRGAGKTYLAGLLAEQMLDAHAQVVILDPVGNWWGLRVGKNGTSKGKEIFIFGGTHGDVPLAPEIGSRIAQLVVEKSMPAVIDISRMRKAERKRFAVDFGEELFQLKKSHASAMHLMVEEAQVFIPQRVGADEARMLGAFEDIVRLGRNYGIGASLISQRPQSINKEVLSQVECLCVLQVNGTHERKALDEWVQEAGADRSLVGQLPGLKQGEGYVWSPSWLRIFKRVMFLAKTTFDASATPEAGKAVASAKLSQMDIESLRTDLADLIEREKQNDPNALRQRIADLERECARLKHTPASSVVDPAAVASLRAKILDDVAEILHREVGMRWAQQFRIMATNLESLAERAEDDAMWKPSALPKSIEEQIRSIPMLPAAASVPPGTGRVLARTETAHASSGNQPKLPKAERSILTVLMQLGRSSRERIAAYSGYAANGGGFRNALSALRVAGLIAESNGGLEITADGRRAIPTPEPLPRGKALLAFWQSRLPKAEREILTCLAGAFAHTMSRDMIAASTGYEVNGGGFRNALSKLRTLELISGSSIIQLDESFAQRLSQ